MNNALPDPEELAKFTHERRARLAIEMGCDAGRGMSPPVSVVDWERIPERERELAIKTARRVLDFLRFGLDLSALDAAVPVAPEPQGKMVLTRAGFAELARRGLVRCYACESWKKQDHRCENPKLNLNSDGEGEDGIGHGEFPYQCWQTGPDFGCIHFKPKATEETDE